MHATLKPACRSRATAAASPAFSSPQPTIAATTAADNARPARESVTRPHLVSGWREPASVGRISMWISPSTLLEHVLELDDPANPAVCDLDRSKVPATAPLVR